MSGIFISYATKDYSQAKAVHDGLEAAGLACWLAPDDVPIGVSWPRAIGEAIQQSQVFVLVFSENANASAGVEQELALANNYNVPVLPFFIEQTKPGPGFAYYLLRIQQLHAYAMSPADALQTLLKNIYLRAPSLREVPRPAEPTRIPSEDRKTSLPPRKVAPPEIVPPALSPFPESLWDMLLESIDEGAVVPVIGPELLDVTIDGRPAQLYSYLAERLAEHLNLPSDDLPTTGPLQEVAGRWLAQGGQPEYLYPSLKRVFPTSSQIGLPESLRQLAKILPLKLFVTTSFDPLLQQALDEERYGRKAETRVLTYSPRDEKDDLDGHFDANDGPVIFHLFGRLSALPIYAVTEEDTLEVVHSLESESRRPARLFGQLAQRKILLIGANLPDWIARSFLRLIQGEPGRLRGKTGVIIADDRLRSDPGFLKYLQRSSGSPQVFQGGAVEFVSQLYSRWMERYPSGLRIEPVPVPEPPPGFIYISFAPEDRDVIEVLARALRAAGLEVWPDLEPGPDLKQTDSLEATARRNITRCSVFIPILSRHTLTVKPRFFRIEWGLAFKENLMLSPSTRFIVPIVIDDVPPNDPALPEEIKRLHWMRLAPNQTNTEIVNLLKQLVRDYRLLLTEER
jgi:hypothetical protein